jgi:hypothetical protein
MSQCAYGCIVSESTYVCAMAQAVELRNVSSAFAGSFNGSNLYGDTYTANPNGQDGICTENLNQRNFFSK